MKLPKRLTILIGISSIVTIGILVYIFSTGTPAAPGFVFPAIFLWLLVIVIGILTTPKPLDIDATLRQLGWETTLPFPSEAHISPHLFPISEITAQEVRPTVMGTRFDMPRLSVVSGSVTAHDKEGHAGILGAPFFYVHGQLPRTIGGWVRVENEPPLPDGARDIDLESTEFNRRFNVHASSSALATAVLSPDMMAWYMDAPIHPTLLVEEGGCYILLTGLVSSIDELQKSIQMCVECLHLLEHSGALVKTL